MRTAVIAAAAAIRPGTVVVVEAATVIGLPATVSGRVSEATSVDADSDVAPTAVPDVVPAVPPLEAAVEEPPDLVVDVDPEPPVELAVETLAAPPVPVAHWVGPCLSQACGCGAEVASLLVPSAENVGLLQFWMLTFCGLPPGILRT
jgi:hypothetical protein